MIKFLVASFLSLGIFVALPSFAREDASASDRFELSEAKTFASNGSVIVSGETIGFTATAGETFIKNRDGAPVAAIWSTSYVRTSSETGSQRPVMFIYNGGPGSASAYLQLGMLGPKLVRLPGDADNDDGAPPFTIVDNPNSLLDTTDLVFVDPVGTGFSQAIGDAKGKDFWSITSDADSMTKFVRQWITRNKRWNSPKYITGLSYGSIRATAVAHMLLGDGRPVELNGLILIGQALEFDGVTSLNGNIRAYITLLPSMAVTAKYHGKAGKGKTMMQFADEAREFALNEYAPALLKGANLPDARRNEIAKRLAYFTGLDRQFILDSDLRVLMPRFRKELLRDRGVVLGFSDGRYTGDEYDDAASDPVDGDPAGYAVNGGTTAAFNHYLATDLGVTMDRPYYMYNRDIGNNWNWSANPIGHKSAYDRRIANRMGDMAIAPALGAVMRKNTDLKVLVAGGYYDLVTPFLGAEITFGRHGIVQDRVDIKLYESGHRIYLHDGSREQLNNDIRAFIGSQ